MKSLKQNSLIFTFGGLTYGLIEIIWRRYTHWTMIITGGTCFLLLFKIFSKAQRLSLLKKCLLGSAIITAVEFLSGCVVNLWFKMDVWDYSKMPGNIKGQVCAAYSFLWLLLSAPVVFLCNTIKTKFRIR